MAKAEDEIVFKIDMGEIIVHKHDLIKVKSFEGKVFWAIDPKLIKKELKNFFK